ncbi:ATP-binding protein [Candidatus Omnitrophota bacterium]
MYIPQKQLENVQKMIQPQKAIIIYGPRRCGKTTLLTKIIEGTQEKHIFANGEDITTQDYLSSQSIEKLKRFVGSNNLLIIDEAQKVKNIGLNIKLMLDNIKGLKIIATGSSSFDLARQLGEPLTGRKYTLKMFPLSQMELGAVQTHSQTISALESRLIYGSYPEAVLMNDDSKRAPYLKEMVSSYLYKDILELEGIRHSDKLIRLLRLLAFQIGKEVSYNELAKQLGMSKNTVDKYLDLLEKSFVIMKMTGFSRNLRKEVSKNPRYYFYDNGIRNGLINNFNPISMRDDIGLLWENYIIMEKIKKQEYTGATANNYFWRTYDQKEIDLIEEYKGHLHGYEIKWSYKKSKIPQEWLDTYPNTKSYIISKDNYLDFIT